MVRSCFRFAFVLLLVSGSARASSETLATLIADGLVDFGDAVSVDVAPEAGDPVDVAVPVGVDQVEPLGPVDDQRGLFTPLSHGGEWVPDVLVVEFCEALSLRHRGQDSQV